MVDEHVKLSVKELMDKYKKVTRIVFYGAAVTTLTSVLSWFAGWFSKHTGLTLTGYDIPSSLLESDLSHSLYDQFENLGSVLSNMSPVLSFMLLISGMVHLFKGRIAAGSTTILMAVILSALFGGIFDGDDKKYFNEEVVSAIINHDMNSPIGLEYIDKVRREDDRYLLAQAAILSHANYPVSYFERVASDLNKEQVFTPSAEGRVAIEMHAFGKVMDGELSDRVEKTKEWAGVVAKISKAFVLVSFGAALFLGCALAIQLNIRRRLARVCEMVSNSPKEKQEG